MSLSDEIKEQQTLEQLREALKRAQQQYGRLKVSRDELVEAVYQAAKDASLGTPPIKVTPPKKDTRKGKPEVAVIHCTDWQLGKKSVSYGSETCAQRIDRFIDKVVHITDIQRKHHPVREAVLMLGGDMVEGMGIFPGQAYEVDSHLYEQLFEVSRLIGKTVSTLASNFESCLLYTSPSPRD